MNRLRLQRRVTAAAIAVGLFLLFCFAERLPLRLMKSGSASASPASHAYPELKSLKGADQQKLNNLTRSLPLAFEANKAPGSSLVEFVCRGRGYALLLSANQ